MTELGESQAPAVSFLGAHQPRIPPYAPPPPRAPHLPSRTPPLRPPCPFGSQGRNPREVRPETDGHPWRLPWGCRSARPPAGCLHLHPRTARGADAPRLTRSAARCAGGCRAPTRQDGVGRSGAAPHGEGAGPGGPGVRPDGAPLGRARGSRAVGLRPARSHLSGAPRARVHSPAVQPRSPEGGTQRPPLGGCGLSGSEDTGGSGDLEWPERKRLRANPPRSRRACPLKEYTPLSLQGRAQGEEVACAPDAAGDLPTRRGCWPGCEGGVRSGGLGAGEWGVEEHL